MEMPQIGDHAPDFETQTDGGESVRLSDYRGKKVVLYFYPKADTPGCTKQACAYRDNYGQFADRDVVVLGVSYDNATAQAAFKEKYNLPFTLLADEQHTIAEQYGLWGDVTFEHKGRQVTIQSITRSTFIIDEDGKIIYSARGVDPTTDTAAVLAHL